MTSTSTAVQPLTLGPATFRAMISTTVEALPHHLKGSSEEIASQRRAACLVMSSLRPRDKLEAMLAGRIIAVHAHVMDDFRSAAQPDLPSNLQLRFQGRAIAMCRLMDLTLRAFSDRHTAPAPRPATPAPQAATGAPAPPASAHPASAHPAPIRPASIRAAADSSINLDPGERAEPIAEIDAGMETSTAALSA